MGDWIAFWDSKHSIYVNARHRDVHYRTIAEHIRAYLPPGATVLDYGCGEALSAEIIVGAARRLILCDAAPTVRAGLAARFADRPAIEVRSPAEVRQLPPGSLDVVVMHSVAQYLTPDELGARLALFRRLLRNDGLLILGDIIPPDVSAATDAMALLRFAAREWLFHRRRVRSHPHRGAHRLHAAAHEPRPHPLRRGRHCRKARGRGLLDAARARKYRPQPGPHDLPGAAEELTKTSAALRAGSAPIWCELTQTLSPFVPAQAGTQGSSIRCL